MVLRLFACDFRNKHFSPTWKVRSENSFPHVACAALDKLLHRHSNAYLNADSQLLYIIISGLGSKAAVERKGLLERYQ